MTRWDAAWTLEDYIRALLKDGKRSQHPDFQKLFFVFGEAKVREIAERILKQERSLQT